MVGHVEDKGRLLGRMKLAGEGRSPNALMILGDEKSSISSFSTIPVSVIMSAPKLVFTVLKNPCSLRVVAMATGNSRCHGNCIPLEGEDANVGGARVRLVRIVWVVVGDVGGVVIRNGGPDLGDVCRTVLQGQVWT